MQHQLFKHGHLLAHTVRPRHCRRKNLVVQLFHYGEKLNTEEVAKALSYKYQPNAHIELRVIDLKYPWLHGDILAQYLAHNVGSTRGIDRLAGPILRSSNAKGLSVNLGGNAMPIPAKLRQNTYAYSKGKTSNPLIEGRAHGVSAKSAFTIKVQLNPNHPPTLSPDNPSVVTRIL